MTPAISQIDAARRRVQAAYDPELLRFAGHRLVELLADHLAAVEAAAGDVLPWRHPTENIGLASKLLQEATSSEAGREALVEQFGRLVESGRFYIVSTQIDGVGALRATIINPLTTAEHLNELLDTIREAGMTMHE